jgi:serine/threonine-protein kinase
MENPSREGDVVAQGRYVLKQMLGRGTFGDVYLAESQQPALTGGQTRVVIKILHTQWASHPEVLERFRRESLVTQKIDHSNVARIFEHAALEDGVPFIAMEYLQGHTLREHLERTRMDDRTAVQLLTMICDALAAAHRAGVVHRDLKPENIQIIERGGDPNYPIVLDFGVAKLLDAAEKLTMTGALLGTPIYMSPEQFRGEPNLGPPADVYAFAVLAYEVITGMPPFDGSSFAQLALAHTNKAPPPLPIGRGNKQLSDLLLRCLEKDAAKRPRAEAVVTQLRTISAARPSGEGSTTLPPVDALAATGKNELALAATMLAVGDAATRTAQTTLAGTMPVAPSSPILASEAAERRKTLLLGVVVFVMTSGLGLVTYFWLL